MNNNATNIAIDIADYLISILINGQKGAEHASARRALRHSINY